MNNIPYNLAKYTCMILAILSIVFHLCILSQLIPYTIVWAGKLNSEKEMYEFESISILINLFYALLLILQLKKSTRISKTILWVFVLLFSLNTIGNLFAESKIEMLIFTPYTIVLALFTARILLEKAS